MMAAEQKPRKERKENADRRRRQLLDAARRSILRHGLVKTTLATVAAEAGLSQGVAVFYFKSKAGLLTETLRDLYQSYEALWRGAVDGAGAPVERLRALLNAEFSNAACGPEVLPVWYAFWGDLGNVEGYAEVAETFDELYDRAVIALWQEVLPKVSAEDVKRIARWVETYTDGCWHRLYLSPETTNRDRELQSTLEMVSRLVPGVFQE